VCIINAARWIVEERKDGANVNGWHWTEKNVTDLAKELLQQSLNDAPDCSEGCRFTKVSTFSGFVNLCNRKGKLKVTYSLEVSLKWKREIRESPDDEPTASASGTIVMEEIFDDDPETEYKLEKKKTNGEGAEPDRNLQQKLCDEAAAHITNLLKRLQSGEIDFSSPEKNNLAANEQLMQVE